MADPVRPTFHLRDWIEALEMTDESLAEASGVSRTHITQLKNGQKVWNERVLMKLARGLGLPDPLMLFKKPGAGSESPAIWDRIPAERREQAARARDSVLESFAEPITSDVGRGRKRRN